MPGLGWATDPHLNFVSPERLDCFCGELIAENPEAVLLTGDLAEAPSLGGILTRIEQNVQRPVYFVLGNHDYYRSSIERVRNAVAQHCRASKWLTYLNTAGVVELSRETALVGHDGWGDAGYGAYWLSRVRLSDFELITDFIGLDRGALWRRLRELGAEAGEHFRSVLAQALPRYRNVIIATHVPPFDRAAWHEGRMSEPGWLPYFSCKAAGEAIREAFENHPQCRGLVVCGHTHGGGEVDILPNLHVTTGAAVYEKPAAQRVLPWT
ncbi:MAG: phosphoesterase [Acidobacteria bacterium]|nr:phosphoesterase [Acidobacteriota bacterium]